MEQFNKLEKPQQVLLKLLSNSLFGGEYFVNESESVLRSMIEESKKQAVTIIAFEGIKNPAQFPQNEYNKFKSLALSSTVNSLRVQASHQKLNDILSSSNIEYTILKGCASAYYYPQKEQRVMGDIDFLINKKDIEKTEKLLKKNGFNEQKSNSEHHIIFNNETEHLELHFFVAGIPNGEKGEITREYFSDIIEKSQEIKAQVSFKKPSHFHHGLILLLHTTHHLFSEGIGLRHLCDWAVFANSFSSEEFCEMFEEALKRIGLWEFARRISLVCVEYLGMPYKEWLGENDSQFNFSIVTDILKGGNFGKKDSSRAKEGFMIASRDEGDFSKKISRQFIKSINEVIYTLMPKARKYKILLPLGWFYYGVRYFIKMLLGKRELLISPKGVRKAKERKEIYSKFNLFK